MEAKLDNQLNQTNHHPFVIAILTVLLLISIALIMLLSWQNQDLSQQLSISQINQKVSTPNPTASPTPNTSGINYSYIRTTYDQQTLTRKNYQDETITFNIPLEWEVFGDRQFGAPYIMNLDFTDTCSQGNISFSYKYTDTNDPSTYKLAQENPHGPIGQTTETTTINGIKMGINNQVTGDGSGGYQPKIVVDFLSRSKRFHYYFKAYMGCHNSHEETFEQDLVPLLNSLILSK